MGRNDEGRVTKDEGRTTRDEGVKDEGRGSEEPQPGQTIAAGVNRESRVTASCEVAPGEESPNSTGQCAG